MTDGSDLMTIEEASAYLHMSKASLGQLRYTGAGPAYYKPTSKTVLYSRGRVDEWLANSERTGTAA